MGVYGRVEWPWALSLELPMMRMVVRAGERELAGASPLHLAIDSTVQPTIRFMRG